jgi:enoyl-CoA hydratase/carnithine racemase
VADQAPVLDVTHDGPVCILTLSRPGRLNALSGELITTLGTELDLIEADDATRVVVITGGPRSDGRPCFSAGADLHELAEGGAAAVSERDFDIVRDVAGIVRGDHLGRSGFRRVLTRIEEFGKPVIAAIDGVCTAGGLELALSCDLRVVAQTAQISDLHVTTTAHTGGAGATSRLSRLVGAAKAKEMIFLGLVVDGTEAHRIGFANRVVPSSALLDEVKAMAAETATRHPIALRMAMALADAAHDLDHDHALRYDHLAWTAQMMTTGGYQGARRFTDR